MFKSCNNPHCFHPVIVPPSFLPLATPPAQSVAASEPRVVLECDYPCPGLFLNGNRGPGPQTPGSSRGYGAGRISSVVAEGSEAMKKSTIKRRTGWPFLRRKKRERRLFAGIGHPIKSS